MKQKALDEDICIIALSSKLSLDDLIKAASKLDSMQIFDADSIASEKHLELAFFHAQEAFGEGTNLAKSLKMEFLLRAAATRQIKVAIDRCGVKNPGKMILAAWGKKGEDKNEILQTLQSKEVKWKPNPTKIISLYGLDKKRKTNLEDQIIEKMVEVQIED